MPIRLLLVDDHRMLRDTLRRSMIEEGFEVIGEASDGLEAVDLAGALSPDVILMDVSMPELDGVEATRAITARDPGQRVVMLTMHSDPEVIERAIEAGAVGYLVKDCSFEEVARTVREAAGDVTVLSAGLAESMLTQLDASDGDDSGDATENAVSPREVEVLQLIADGCSSPEVAERLFISQKTVKNHLASIYTKLDARDRTQAVLQAVRMGIIRLR